MNKILIKNGFVVSTNEVKKQDTLIEGEFIKDIQDRIVIDNSEIEVLDVTGYYVFPGIIDSHVHFREPGLTHKGTIESESKAALAGGVTSVIDMPNTIPYAGNIEQIVHKKNIASNSSYVNIGFFVGAKNDNLEELLKFPKNEVAGIKVFLGSSTGDVTIENSEYLRKLFSNSFLPIVIHSESESVIKKNTQYYKNLYGDDIPFNYHSKIRSREACIDSTVVVIELAKLYGTSVHILHVSTAEEIDIIGQTIFDNITAEVCTPHLWFCENDFSKYTGFLKCNPSVKTEKDKEALRNALKTKAVYTIGTDHAPHTIIEKQNKYFQCPSGVPSIQHSLLSILELYHMKYIDLTTIAKKMAYYPAKKFNIKKRGNLIPGYFADITIVDLNSNTYVEKQNLLYKCNWSLFEHYNFSSSIKYTIVNGVVAYGENKLLEEKPTGKLLEYEQ